MVQYNYMSVKQKNTIRARARKHVRLAVVPHKANHYRPHAVRRYGIALILLLVFAVQGGYNGVTGGNVLGVQPQVTAVGLLDATNQARAGEGQQPLAINEKLSQAAQLKAQDMFAQQYWAHTAPNGTKPWHWFGEAGYAYIDAGENLAKNFTTSGSAVSAWLASPTHRANVLKPEYRDVGFAVVEGVLEGEPTTIVVALYGTPEAAAVQGAAGVRPQTQVSKVDTPLSLMARIGVGMQTITPVALASVVVLLLAANIALLAHVYRRKLPLTLRRSWYRHHGAYKAAGFASVAVVIVAAYSSIGQI